MPNSRRFSELSPAMDRPVRQPQHDVAVALALAAHRRSANFGSSQILIKPSGPGGVPGRSRNVDRIASYASAVIEIETMDLNEPVAALFLPFGSI